MSDRLTSIVSTDGKTAGGSHSPTASELSDIAYEDVLTELEEDEDEGEEEEEAQGKVMGSLELEGELKKVLREANNDDVFNRRFSNEEEKGEEKEEEEEVEETIDSFDSITSNVQIALQNSFFNEKMKSLTSEEVNSTVNQKKLDRKWRKVLRMDKVEDLKGLVRLISQLHDKEVERKDNLIFTLWKELQNQEKQFEMIIAAHKNSIDELIGVQRRKIVGLEKTFASYLKKLSYEFEEEMKEINQIHRERLVNFKEIYREMLVREQAKEDDLVETFEVGKKDIENKSTKISHAMVNQMKSRVHAKAKIIVEEAKETEKTIQSKHEHWIAYRTKDQENQNKIKYQNVELKKYETALSFWKAKCLNNFREFQTRNSQLIKEINILKKHFHEVKKRMNSFRAEQKRKLTLLVKASRSTQSHLEGKIKVAKKMIDSYLFCRGMETEFEKNIENFVQKEGDFALSFYQTMKQEKKDFNIDNVIMMNSEKLAKFFRKFNKVIIDKLHAKERNSELKKENKFLKSQIKKYIDGISVNNEIMNDGRSGLLLIKKMAPKSKMRMKSHI